MAAIDETAPERHLGGSRNTATAPPGRPRTAAELDQWEAAHGCKLPLEYRSFLSDFGEGAYYPFGELVPLSQWWHHLTGVDSCRESLPWLQATFEIPERFNSSDEWESWLAEWQRVHPIGPEPWAGTIALTDDGCGMLIAACRKWSKVRAGLFSRVTSAPAVVSAKEFPGVVPRRSGSRKNTIVRYVRAVVRPVITC